MCGAIGAFLGDNTAYLIGSRMSGWIKRRAEQNPKRQRRLDWATEQIRVRGGLLLITARFIPGGRTALTLSSGITHQPRRWFMGWTAAAVIIWASYAALLGYIGGKAFEDDHTKAFLVAFGRALGVNVVIELVRHFRSKHAMSSRSPGRRMPGCSSRRPSPAASPSVTSCPTRSTTRCSATCWSIRPVPPAAATCSRGGSTS